MPRSFDLQFDSPASVEQVHGAFCERDYWVARLEHFGGTATLDSLVVDADGAVRVVVVEDLRHGALPGLLTTFYRGDLNITTTEVWTPIGGGQVSGDIDVVVNGAPGSGRGSATLARSGSGSQMTLRGTVHFKVPLVGGTVESFLAREFAHGLPRVHRFTATWLSENV